MSDRTFFETSNGRYYLGDVREVLGDLPDETFDAVITDPPFFEKSRKGEGNYDAYRECLQLLHRKMKPNSWLIVYFPSNRLHVLLRDTTKHFEYVDRFVVVFDSTQTKGALGSKTTLELCVFKKGRPKQIERFSSDVIMGIDDPALLILHPKNPLWKPTLPTTLVLKKIVGVGENKRILDPFAGMGSILFVAEKLGIRWLGIDLDEGRWGIAKRILVDKVPPRIAIEEAKKKDGSKVLPLIDGRGYETVL